MLFLGSVTANNGEVYFAFIGLIKENCLFRAFFNLVKPEDKKPVSGYYSLDYICNVKNVNIEQVEQYLDANDLYDLDNQFNEIIN